LPVQKEGAQDFLITFPQPDDDTVHPGQLSTLNLSLEPQPATPLRDEQVVPDVIGYTELVARRLLTKRGFQAEVMDQATDKPEEVDRVIDQEPKGGASTGPGQGLHKPVTLFLGRAGNSGG
jgi:beta-lactam-binding protein with PASTA domain